MTHPVRHSLFTCVLALLAFIFAPGFNGSVQAQDNVGTIWSASFRVKNHTQEGVGTGYDRAGRLYRNSAVTRGSDTFIHADREFAVSEFHRLGDGFTFAFQWTRSARPSETDREQWTLHFDAHSRAFRDAVDVDGAHRVFEWQDLEGVPAWSDGYTLTLRITKPVPGVTTSKGAPAVKAVVITSNPGPDETYAAGDVIEVRVTFSEAVEVTGSPQLGLTMGSTGKQAVYAGGAGTPSLVFAYTVAEGDEDSDGVSLGADSLMLDEGMIRDAAGNDAEPAHQGLAAQSGQKVDGVGPVLAADETEVDGTELRLPYEEALDESSTPAADDFRVTVAGEKREVSAVAVEGSEVRLTLVSPAEAGEAAAVSYAVAAESTAKSIRDLAGNLAEGFTDRAAANRTGGALPARAVRQIQAILEAKQKRTPAQRKMGSQLLEEWQKAQGRPGADRMVTVDLRAEVTPKVLERIRELGGTVLSSFERYRAIRAQLPLSEVEALAAHEAVRSIRTADKAVTRKRPRKLSPDILIDVLEAGSRTTQGDVAHQANTARTTHGVDGTGIGIGVLSDGVGSLAARQATGDLPARVTVLPGQEGEGDEGTAMLEIVHDLAPGAELYFATAFGGQARFAANIEALCEAGADIIVDDVYNFFEGPFQDDIIAQGVNAAVADGCFYFSAGGNAGNKNDGTAGVWEGDFAAGSPLVFNGVTVGTQHEFGGGVTQNRITEDSDYAYILWWADPLEGSANDYDLFLVDENGDVLRSSTRIQDGTRDPYEYISSGVDDHTDARLVIVQVSGAADRYLRLDTLEGQLAVSTAGSLFGHSAAENAIAVAAVAVQSAGGTGGVFDGTESVRTSNSDGPRRIFFEPDGTPITAGNFSSTGGKLLQKPDLAAATCVRTTTPGFSIFCGVSSAAPHAAAIGALVLEAAEGPKSLTQAQLLTAMTGAALDIEASGVDRDSGAGIVMAPGAVDAVDVAAADRNQAPTVEDRLDDRTFALGSAAVTLDLADTFDDPDNDTLTYSALSSNTARASLSRTGSMLTLTPGAPGTAQVTVRAADPEGLSAVDSFSVSVTVGTRDYDRDDDDLIEVSTLAQLDAIRYDSNGNGVVDDPSDWPSYFAAFTQATLQMGCPNVCIGYELAANLDFDTDSSGGATDGDTYWNDGDGWEPIGPNAFQAVFEGNGHTIANLFIDRSTESDVGLFSEVGEFGEIHNVGLVAVEVTAKDYVGGLVGDGEEGRVGQSYVTGSVSGDDVVGGLAGSLGTVFSSYAAVRVSGTGDGIGGLAGAADIIVVSYATGRVTGGGMHLAAGADCESVGGVGGLVGNVCGAVAASYATGPVSGTAAVGGLAGTGSARFLSSFWDTETSGIRVGFGADDLNDNGVVDASESPMIGVAGRDSSALQSPTSYSGIYQHWNRDLDGDGKGEDPWHFGMVTQYPALSVDTDGGGTATWQELGYQLRSGPTLTVTSTSGQAQVSLTWTAVAVNHWSPAPGLNYTLYRDDGTTVEAVATNLTTRTHTDTDVTLDATYTYQVAAVVEGGEAVRSGWVSVAAGASNQPPVPVRVLADLTLRVGEGTGTVTVSGAFRDPESDTLTYAASSSATTVATVSASGAEVTVTPVAAGRTTVTVTATDAGGSNTSATQSFTVTVWSASAVDYDSDDDGLIEISSLAQLNVIRHDRGGDGNPTADGKAAYEAAFSDAVEWMGCNALEGCSGYELTADLDFDTNGNGAADAGDTYWNNGAGWTPIGGEGTVSFGSLLSLQYPYLSIFEGNGHTISHLFIDTDTAVLSGLFGYTFLSSIRNVGLIDVEVDVGSTGLAAGLVAFNAGEIRTSYVTGRVSGKENVGGLVGINQSIGEVRGCYATSNVTGEDDVGGLVADNRGIVTSSYATGRVTGVSEVGGLVGFNQPDGEIQAGYATGRVSGASNAGGLVGSNEGTVSNSYWDTRTSGQTTGREGRTTVQLQSPTGYSGLYRNWNLDLDGDGTNDSPWHFGTSSQYPVLSADVGGDGEATWQEFGYQLREGPSLTGGIESSGVALTWTAAVAGHWSPAPAVTYTLYRDEGTEVKTLAENLSGLGYTDTDVIVGETYTYQVAAVVRDGEATRSALVATKTIALPNMWLSPTASDPVAAVRSAATYSVTFQGTWTTAVTSGSLPSGAHFTTLIGGVHNAGVTFLSEGGMASAGVESMAELGGTSTLATEVNRAKPNALTVLQGSGGNIGPTGSSTINPVTLTTDHPRVTLLSMVAPSPDWFVGVSGLSLLDAQGEWLASRALNLYPWDAGTEEGTEFSLSNAATSPQGVITSLRGTGKFSNAPIATLTFTRQSINTAPSITGDTSFEVDENQTAVATLQATDDDTASDQLTWSIPSGDGGGADAHHFVLSSTGVLAFSTAKDYENPDDAGADRTYEVRVQVSDGANPVEADLIVRLLDVDDAAPTVNSLAITSDPGTDRTYASGDEIQVTVTFSETVEVTGRPQLRLEFGGGTRTATYEGGSGTTALVIAYKVADGESDTDGVGVEADSLTGGTIRDEARNNAELDHDGLASDSGHKVDGVKPELAASGGAVVNGTTLTLTYDEPLDGGSRPASGNFTVAGGDHTRTVSRVSVSASTVVLTLNVGAEHLEAGIQVSYTPETNRIRDVPGNQAEGLSRESVRNDTPDTTPPEVESLGITSNPGSDQTYAAEDEIEVTVSFNETVEVTGMPQLRLRVGRRNRTAGYDSGTGTAALVFAYEVADGDEDTVGVSIEAGRIALNGGTIKDEADNAAELAHEALATQAGHKVDGVRPAFVSAAVEGASLTLTYGEALDEGSRPASGDFTVTVDGAGRTVNAVEVDGSTVTLTLNPAVEHGDTGIRVSYAPGANPIQDEVGNDAQGLSNRSVTNTTGAPNTDPEITSPSSFDVPENQIVARRLVARDTDPGDEVTGWDIVGGADQGQFEITSDTGELNFLDAPNYEAPGDNQYLVTVEVRSGAGARELTVEKTFTISVTDDQEPPAVPEAPTFSGETADSLQVNWNEPDNTGPPITGYDVQYREKGPGGFSDGGHEGPGLSLTLSDLNPGTAYEVQVQARNDEGASDWSASGEGMTVTPLTVVMASGTEPPVSGPFTMRFSFSEPVTGFSTSDFDTEQDPACRDDQNNTIFCEPGIGALETADDRVYTATVTPWTDRVAHSYTLRLTVPAGAVRSLVGSKPNEEPEGPLEVRVSPPGAPEPVSSMGLGASVGSGSVSLSWNRPTEDGGSAIIRYEYRFAAVGEAWSEWENVGAGTRSVTVGNLVNGREYVFEVRAVNGLGKGEAETVRAVPELRIAPPRPPPAPRPPGNGDGGGLLFPPEAPAGLMAMAGEGAVLLKWSPPASDGGAPILRYEYRLKEGRGEFGEWTPIEDSAPDEVNALGYTVGELGNGTVYAFELRAVNLVGEGRVSEAVEVVMGLDPAYWSNFGAEDLQGSEAGLEHTPFGGTPRSLRLRFGAGLRFEESELDGEGEVTGTRSGGYRYRYTSRTTGELSLDYDGGEVCELRMTFRGVGAGSYSYRCGGRLGGQGSFRLSGLNRAPEITGAGVFEVAENTLRVGRVEAVDPDEGDEIRGYGIAGGADGALFAVVEETGDLRFREAPDYEDPGDVESADPRSGAGDNEYVVVVEVSSGEGERERRGSRAIRVRVSDEEEPPEITGVGVFEVVENRTRVGQLEAVDPDEGDEIEGYGITGGADGGLFAVVEETGELLFRGAPDYEDPGDVESAEPVSGAGDNEYIVVVEVSSGEGERERKGQRAIRVRVTDEEEPPGAPAAPAVTAEGSGSLKVSWSEPENRGPEIVDYEVRYREAGEEGYSDGRHQGTGLEVRLSGLKEGTVYEVQVRAVNEEGMSEWSEPGEGRTDTEEVDPDDPSDFTGKELEGRRLTLRQADADGTTRSLELRFGEGNRFEQIESGGQEAATRSEGASRSGSYSYEKTGPGMGTVRLAYDDGASCEVRLSFTESGLGGFAYDCGEGDPAEGRFRLTTGSLFVPVILSAAGQNQSLFTSELTLTNRGEREARLHYTYTAHIGGGSGRASDVLAPGRQKIETDALVYLRSLGIAIPETGNRIGTLRVEVPITSEVRVVVRTTTAVDDGRAGLAYAGIPEEERFEEAVYLCGLRQNSKDRSNLAFQNMGAPEEGAITMRTTVYSGESGDTSARVLEDVKLEPGGFHQYSGLLRVLESVDGNRHGYVKVERVEGRAPFYAYGVINDQANSDGSFVFPVTASSLEGRMGQTLPVMVETSAFTSELTVTNFSEEPRTLQFSFVADGVETPDRTADFTLMPMRLEGGEQRILADIVNRLRQQGVEGIGPSRGGYAGPLFATAENGDMSGIVIGARTGSEGGGGQYSVFYNAVPVGAAFSEVAWIDALQQNGENRSNLALVNTGEVDDSDSVFSLEIYDGETGLLVTTIATRPIPARGWHQINGILGSYAPETRQGYVRIRKVSGQNPFLAYGVVNDGGAPGERSGDGAYLPARE